MQCSYPPCDRPSYVRGLCQAHYQQARRGRTLTSAAPYMRRNRVSGTLAERLTAKSERRPDGCLVWAGTLKTNGYGRIVYGGRDLHVHRAAYELSNGPIPNGLTIDHLCRNRACIEPSHMEVVTRGENTRRGATKSHCKRGHPLDGDNVRWKQRGPYRVRDCRACDAIRKRERLRQQ